MTFSRQRLMSRRRFCLCCVGGAAYTATGGWLTPREAFAEARGLVTLIKDSAAVSPIVMHKLRNNVSVLEGCIQDNQIRAMFQPGTPGTFSIVGTTDLVSQCLKPTCEHLDQITLFRRMAG